jgi:phage shock protein A
VEHLKSDLEKLESDTKTVVNQYEGEQKVRKQYEEQKEQLKKDMDEKQLKIKELETNIKRLKELSHNIKEDILRATGERVDIEGQIKLLETNKKD